jgi:hypothetical protein
MENKRMPRTRSNHRAFPQQEPEGDVDYLWLVCLFLLGGLLTAFIIHMYFINLNWHAAARFFIVAIPSMIMGSVFVLLHYIIRVGIGFLILLTLISIIAQAFLAPR